MSDERMPPGEGAPEPAEANEPSPLGQRLRDRPIQLLGACIVVMCVFFTGWGLWEIASRSEAPLP
jgi:hypothetical protein